MQILPRYSTDRVQFAIQQEEGKRHHEETGPASFADRHIR